MYTYYSRGVCMKNIKYLLLIVLLLLSFNVKAKNNCENDEYQRLKDLAKKVEFDYDYKLVNGEAEFSINAVNLNSELKVLIIEDYYNDKYKEFKDNASHKATLTNFKSGEKVTVTIKGFVPNFCSGKTVATKLIKLPYYNKYYSEEKCKGYEEFKYCKRLIDKNIKEEEFNRLLEEYKKEKDKKEDTPVVPQNDNRELYLIIGIASVSLIIITLVVMIIVKRRKKYSL